MSRDEALNIEFPPLRVCGGFDILSAVSATPKASLTQLVECHLAKVVVEGSSPLARSIRRRDCEWEHSSAGRASDS